MTIRKGNRSIVVCIENGDPVLVPLLACASEILDALNTAPPRNSGLRKCPCQATPLRLGQTLHVPNLTLPRKQLLGFNRNSTMTTSQAQIPPCLKDIKLFMISVLCSVF